MWTLAQTGHHELLIQCNLTTKLGATSIEIQRSHNQFDYRVIQSFIGHKSSLLYKLKQMVEKLIVENTCAGLLVKKEIIVEVTEPHTQVV